MLREAKMVRKRDRSRARRSGWEEQLGVSGSSGAEWSGAETE